MAHRPKLFTPETETELDSRPPARDQLGDIVELTSPAPSELAESMPEGQLFTIRAILNGPNGQSAVVLSVWFVRTVGGVPRFVTAYPGASK